MNTYVFMDALADRLSKDDIVIAGNGMDVVSFYAAFRVKPGQRGIYSGNWGAMGWDLPQAVGAAVAGGGRRVVLVTGDGSIQLNIQELLTLGHNSLPVCVFVFNNEGYSSIRATQSTFFAGPLRGRRSGQRGRQSGFPAAGPGLRPWLRPHRFAPDRAPGALDRVLSSPCRCCAR